MKVIDGSVVRESILLVCRLLFTQSLLNLGIDAIGGEIDRVQVLVPSFVEALEREILVLEIRESWWRELAQLLHAQFSFLLQKAVQLGDKVTMELLSLLSCMVLENIII